MYSTCLFCNGQLGKNEAIEHFPVGRRLAFDGAKGRLWVVCRKCERWNLTPLEERWEALEECERAFRKTRLRASTDQIGLARLKEGLELVRVGAPLRPEMAAWRYGDQFGRRRRRDYAMVAGSVAVGGAFMAGPLIGLGGIGTFQLALQILASAKSVYRFRKVVHLQSSQHVSLRVRLSDLPKTRLYADGQGVVLRVSAAGRSAKWWDDRGDGPTTPWWKYDSTHGGYEVDLTGDEALRAAGALLPRMNFAGGSKREVKEAVEYLEVVGDPMRLFRRAVDAIERMESSRIFGSNRNSLKTLPTAGRLALEMAAHEDAERRALDGELHVLEAAWKAAEEIAEIADGMFVPSAVEQDLARLKQQRDDG